MSEHPFSRCDHWQPNRCDRPGEVWLICPDGRPCPGGRVCREHAQAVVDEYRDRLGEAWGFAEVRP